MSTNIATRSEFGALISELINISSDYQQTASQLHTELSVLPQQVENFSVCVPVIGMFSAGKSSLLNAWLEQELLPEDQDATTAIATEIHYAGTASMRVILDNGGSCDVSSLPQDAEEANSSDIPDGDYAICTSNSKRLKQLREITLVDMPGTDSDIKRHTEALFRYANKGVAYLLVLDAGSGTIPASLLTFLGELDLSDKALLIAIHKSDKYTDEHLEDVENNVLIQCKDLHCPPPHLIRTSIREDDTPERVHNLLMQLNTEHLCVSSFSPKVTQLGERLGKHIETLRDNSELDTFEITKKIQSLMEASRDIEETIKREEHKLSQELRTRTLENIVTDVSRELNQNLDELCEIAEVGDQQILTNKVTGIVNRVCEESIQRNISASIDVLLAKVEESVSLSSEGIASTLKFSVEGASSVMEGILQVVKKGGATYKTVTTILAITSGVVMPVIELLIIFLPDILKFFSNPEEQRRKQIREKLTSDVFPKIKSQIRKELQKQIPEIEKDILQGLRAEWDGRLNETISALSACREEKVTEETDWKQSQIVYNNDIKTVSTLLERLTTH